MKKSRRSSSLSAALRDFFVPYPGNAYQPYSLRAKAAIGVLLFIVLVEALLVTNVALRFASKDFLALVLPDAIVSLTNGQRQAQNLPPLAIDPTLSKAAQAHADEMAAKGYFAHVSPEGNLPWVWFNKYGYPYQYAGENLAVNFFDSSDVVSAWMNSPTHRENIMRQQFSEIGIGIATGTYEGRVTTFVVQFFGTKKAQAAPLAQASAPAPAPALRPVAAPAPAPTPQPQAAPQVSQTNPAPVPQVEGEATASGFWSTLKQILRTAPRVVSNYIFLTMLTLLVASFLLAFFIKLRIQYARIIAHGLALIALTFGIMLANNVLFSGDIEVPDHDLNAAVYLSQE